MAAAALDSRQQLQQSIVRIFRLIKLEEKEIRAIYFYAILYGLLMLSLPLGIQSIINFVLAGTFSTSMVVLIVGVVVGVFFSGVLQVTQMKLNEKIQQNLFTQYAFEFSYRIPKIDSKSVDGYFMPELVNRFFDVISLQKGISKLLLDLPVASIQILFGMVLLSFYNSVFIVFGLILIILLFIILWLTSSRGLQTSLLESDYKYKVASWLQEMARIMRSIKFARDTNIHMYKTDRLVAGYLQARTSHFKVLLSQYWSMILFKVIITAAMLMVGGVLLLDQQINVGQFVAAEIVILTILSSIEKFIVSLDKVYDVLTSVEKLGKVIDKPMELDGTAPLDVSKGISVGTKQLYFAFNDDHFILKGATMHVPAGSIVSIQGNEGAGKSTLLRMFTGSYSAFTGSILVNDLPIGSYQLDGLRKHVGIYFSQQEIFEGSLWENITLGNAEYTMTEIMEMADKIGLKPFISSLKDGFDTALDPMGRRLNKATTQKILFLRALSGKPKLLLLEEPWEGMDYDSIKAMVDLMVEKMKGGTIITASNDDYFITKSNLRFTMNDGVITQL